MAQIVTMALEKTPEALVELDVDTIIVIQNHPKKELSESFRCLDWALNHQLRKAVENITNAPVFIPTMSKIKASFVVLSTDKLEKKRVEDNIVGLGMKSAAVLLSGVDGSNSWTDWAGSSLERVVLCSEISHAQGESV